MCTDDVGAEAEVAWRACVPRRCGAVAQGAQPRSADVSTMALCSKSFSVECRKDKDVIDETPMAYKDIEAVMAAQANLVDVMHTLKQVVCVKG